MKEDLINNLLQSAVFVRIDKGTGSGFIISEKGDILTCYHVVENCTEIEVLLNINKQYFKAKRIRDIPEYDISFLKIEYPEQLPKLVLANSEARIGKEVLYFGYPLTGLIGFPLLHISKGTIANNIEILNEDYNTNVSNYVIDSVNSEGFSGSPLCSLDTGEVLGIVSSRFDPLRAALARKLNMHRDKGIRMSSKFGDIFEIDSVEGIKVAGFPLADRTNITFAIKIKYINGVLS